MLKRYPTKQTFSSRILFYCKAFIAAEMGVLAAGFLFARQLRVSQGKYQVTKMPCKHCVTLYTVMVLFVVNKLWEMVKLVEQATCTRHEY